MKSHVVRRQNHFIIKITGNCDKMIVKSNILRIDDEMKAILNRIYNKFYSKIHFKIDFYQI